MNSIREWNTYHAVLFFSLAVFVLAGVAEIGFRLVGYSVGGGMLMVSVLAFGVAVGVLGILILKEFRSWLQSVSRESAIRQNVKRRNR